MTMPSPLADWALVLVRTQGPINLGLVMRACGNTGLEDVRLVRPLCEVDCDDSRKFANHARHRLPELPVHADLPAALADRDLVIGTSARSRDGERGRPLDLRELPAFSRDRGARRPALVFGNEADGLDETELAHCQVHVQLPTPGDYPSYNLSHAVAICCYQLAQQALPLPDDDEEQASQDDRERLMHYWLDTLERFRYFRRSPRERFEPRFRRLVDKMALSKRDCEHLRGMFTQFNYMQFGEKFEKGRPPGRP